MQQHRILLVPGNNSLSHMAKCLAVAEEMRAGGAELMLAASRKSAHLLNDLSFPHEILPDIQEVDGAAMPTLEWFKYPEKVRECIVAETDLIQRFKPDRVLGVFRFTLKISAALTKVPYDSLICGCMLPGGDNVLGFEESDAEALLYKNLLAGFYSYAAKKVNPVIEELGVNPISDIRQMLTGARTFLWDMPEFNPLPQQNGEIYVGPVSWRNWPVDDIPESTFGLKRPLALIASGTCTSSVRTIEKTAKILLGLGFDIIVAAGGQKKLLKLKKDDSRVTVCRFAPISKILPRVSLLVSHGGQMTIFEALENQVPVLVIPLQPEQAHNGLCLERIGCGRLLVGPAKFVGDSAVYVKPFLQQHDADIAKRIKDFLGDDRLPGRLEHFGRILSRYKGAREIARRLQQ